MSARCGKGVADMVVVRLGPEVRKWAAVAAAAGLFLGLLRWGLVGGSTGVATNTAGTSQGPMAVSERVVALTFDATANDRLEPVVQALTQAHLPGTFFVDAAYAHAHPAPLRALIRAGDEVEVLLDGSISGLGAAAAAVGTAAQAPPLFVRPVDGRVNAALTAGARRAGLAVNTPSQAATDGTADLHPGDILSLPAGAAGAAAVTAVSHELVAGEFQAMTLEDMAAIADGAAAVSLPGTP